MPALVEEFALTSLEEIDYLHEAASAERFAADFGADDRVSVPMVVWERTTRRVLTLEDVTAIKITDVDALQAAGIDPTEVAPAFAAVPFDQLFTTGFFHADPHPGNIFVTPAADGLGGRPWKLTFIDFGMMGEVPANTRSGAETAGSTGPAVRAVQDQVNHRNLKGSDYLAVDGVFGPNTEASVRGFQSGMAAQLPFAVDGVVGPSTWKAFVIGWLAG